MVRTFVTSALLLLATTQISFAQPAPENATTAANPANARPPFLTDKEMEKVFKDTQAMMQMTPEEMRAKMHNLNQQMMRTLLTQSGFKEKALQDDILLFIDEQEKTREPVRIAAGKIQQAINHFGPPVDATEMEVLLRDYLAAVENAKVEREALTKAFSAKMNLDVKSYLRAVLLLNGIIGDASSLTGDIIGTGVMAQAALPTLAPAVPAAG